MFLAHVRPSGKIQMSVWLSPKGIWNLVNISLIQKVCFYCWCTFVVSPLIRRNCSHAIISTCVVSTVCIRESRGLVTMSQVWCLERSKAGGQMAYTDIHSHTCTHTHPPTHFQQSQRDSDLLCYSDGHCCSLTHTHTRWMKLTRCLVNIVSWWYLFWW